ncbi:hypothetical protein ABIB38_001644 [Massilia sp. UYP11]
MASPGAPRPAGAARHFFPATAFFTELFGTVNMTDVQDIQRRIIELDVEHRDLDAVISLLTADGHADQLQLRRLKKRKLQLKDHITLLKMQLVPDIPA